MPTCQICGGEYENKFDSKLKHFFTKLNMLCEKCKRDIKTGKYGDRIIKWLEKYSVEKQKKELRERLEKIEKEDSDNVVFSKEAKKHLTLSYVVNKYGIRNTPFREAWVLKSRITRFLNLHKRKRSNERDIMAWNNYIGRYGINREALKIHNDIFNDLTSEDIKKYLKGAGK